jgi:hypothetical protein
MPAFLPRDCREGEDHAESPLISGKELSHPAPRRHDNIRDGTSADVLHSLIDVAGPP